MSKEKKIIYWILVLIVIIVIIIFICTNWVTASVFLILFLSTWMAIYTEIKESENTKKQKNKRILRSNSIRLHLQTAMDESQGVLNLDKLTSILEVASGDEKTFPKRSLDHIMTTLTSFDYGLVPNYQLGHRRPTYGDMCVVYKLTVSPYNLRSSVMRQKELFFKLLSIVFCGESISSEDSEYIKRCISGLDIANEFQGHFYAYMLWLSQKKQPFDKKTKDDLALLSATVKQSYAKLLLNGVYVNGSIDNKRVEALKKVLPYLGFEASSVHSLLHQTLTDEGGFTKVEKKPQTQSQDYAVLDHQKLNELKAQTRAAQDLLSEIFVEEEEAPKPNLEQKENSLVDVLAKLLEKEVWTRDEVKELVGANVMIGNLLEEINDYAYSKIDDIVVEEDGDQIYVTTDYKNQLI